MNKTQKSIDTDIDGPISESTLRLYLIRSSWSRRDVSTGRCPPGRI